MNIGANIGKSIVFLNDNPANVAKAGYETIFFSLQFVSNYFHHETRAKRLYLEHT